MLVSVGCAGNYSVHATTHGCPTLALVSEIRLLMTSSFMWEGRTSSYCTLILVSEKEAKSLQKRGNGKVCPVTARRGLHSELHTRSGLSVVIGMTWRAWACWRAAATDAPRLASSQYRLERLRADMTLSVRFVLNFGHKKLVLFCTFQCVQI